jgi:hypothetical protein
MQSKKIKGILIDVVNQNVSEVEIEQGLQPIYEILQCELIVAHSHS